MDLIQAAKVISLFLIFFFTTAPRGLPYSPLPLLIVSGICFRGISLRGHEAPTLRMEIFFFPKKERSGRFDSLVALHLSNSRLYPCPRVHLFQGLFQGVFQGGVTACEIYNFCNTPPETKEKGWKAMDEPTSQDLTFRPPCFIPYFIPYFIPCFIPCFISCRVVTVTRWRRSCFSRKRSHF